MTIPRLGFLGAGWIGRQRMLGLAASGVAQVAGIADMHVDAAREAAAAVPGAHACRTLCELLSLGVDGIVIATPNALHAAQAITALDAGAAVFCQKPLGRTAAEVRQVIAAARRADRLLGVDFSYRFTRGLRAIRDLVETGSIGTLYSAELTFHNAYGPDKPWFYDRAQSGGGCVIDLGVHLIDLALWMFDVPVVGGTSRMFHGGKPASADAVEDFASIRLDFEGGGTAQIACSWRLPAGREAVIEAAWYGTRGAARWRNINGSFYDFAAERMDGTRAIPISEPPDDWGPAALIDWAARLRDGSPFDESATRALDVATVIDAIYATAETTRQVTPQLARTATFAE